VSPNVTRREFIGTAVGTAVVSGAATAQLTGASGPNVLFILADDLGYGDLSCYGRPDYRTPVLDSFARQGIKFMSAYAAAPVCTPTRCAFVTGRYPQRLAVGLEEPLTANSPTDAGLPPDHPTVASLLKKNGYETALIGKWHLGWKPEYGPNRHGYDEFFGILSGAADYFTHGSTDAPGTSTPGGAADLWENLTPVERAGYLTDLLSDRAVEYLGRSRTRPFYLSLHYNAPHAPWEGPEDAGADHTAHGAGPMTNGGTLKIYASMMKSMDAGIGRVLKALSRAKLDRQTLVIFTSDNGGERYSYNWPFSFQKLYLWEGGTRVPAMVRWPGVIPAGQVSEQASITMDWTATILAATRTAADPAYPMDGEDLLSVCKGGPMRDRMLFWRTRLRDAARAGSWKYLKDAGEEHLFDLSNDPGEKADLKSAHPDVFEKIKAQFLAWNTQMLPKPSPPQTPQARAMKDIAERYVKLVLALGQHDADYVDAFYGPPAWKADAEKQKTPLDHIGADAGRLIADIPEPGDADRRDELVMLRHAYLRRQLQSLLARVRMLQGEKLTFDAESQALYDAVAPVHPESYFEGVLQAIERWLPGQGPLAGRYEAFRQEFIVPHDRLARVFDRAIAEGRGRTLTHVQLPATETFTVEYVTNKPWGGYNWYQGNYRSLIQVNTDLPIYIDRAIDLACHEGYPGHHVYNVLLEQHLVRERGWSEFSVYALFSPQSLIAEGTANCGIDVAFPGDERLAFERDVLFPEAGLDASQAAKYAQVRSAVDRLSYAGNEAARRYLNGEIDRAAAAAWLVRYALSTPKQAEQRTRFFDTYRSYVINYNLGKDLVQQFVESRGGVASQPAKRWAEFARLLASPRLPSGLR
jgi:arylsulfatase A-like enzyme